MLICGSGKCSYVVSARIHGLIEALQPRAVLESGATLVLTATLSREATRSSVYTDLNLPLTGFLRFLVCLGVREGHSGPRSTH